MQFSYEYSPTLISAPFNLPLQQSPLLRMKTSETGTTCSRSTFHQGLVDLLVCVQYRYVFNFCPLTAILEYRKSYKLDWSVGFLWARSSKKCKNTGTFPTVPKKAECYDPLEKSLKKSNVFFLFVCLFFFSVKSILFSPFYTVNILHSMNTTDQSG